MNKSCILVVDDDPINFDVIEALLDRCDYEFHYVNSGESALVALNKVNPDLILLDVMMPGINGAETCQKIRAQAQWKTVPIIMVTALDNNLIMSHCLTAGANDFVTKPINSIELKARIQSMLRMKQQYDEIQNLSALQANTVSFLQETLDELRGNLARSLSHELNTPINGILGTLSLLKDDLEEMDVDEIKEILDWTETSTRRLEGLTQKFLIYLELELKHSSSSSQEDSEDWLFPGDGLLAELSTCAQKMGRASDLMCDFDAGPVSISQRYLVIALRELVDNALKFSQPDTPINVMGKIDQNQLTLTVQDFGRGMTPEQTTKIGAFMQFDRQLYEQQGVGIGLRIVHKIVEQAGGTFEVHSQVASGTKVMIHLPLNLAIAPDVNTASINPSQD
ncbi:hybrid sensor histidine kinase/response regulator [Leptolyngbya iicbica]|uniref:histidine kinase n=2 Tax=Cyanophyceae TaxID=3028117 RepID=A0A4Q7E2A4_9CYAN|nr:hybrid sensor histidine kinase/response regulator [Leptolyngbya sp. LK]RZM75479.1 hybrid sensor histidine kinase/response regulator [Leptolyngbya sp. LK]